MKLDLTLITARIWRNTGYKSTAQGLAELTSLDYDVSVRPLAAKLKASVLVISFIGSYGYGSRGNKDAILMEAVIGASLETWPSIQAIILNLRQLSYRWGDAIDKAFVGSPLMLVISDINREGLTSFVDEEMQAEPSEWLYESFDAAVMELEKRLEAQKYLLHYYQGRGYVEYTLKDNQLFITRSYLNDKLISEESYFQNKVTHRKIWGKDGTLTLDKAF